MMTATSSRSFVLADAARVEQLLLVRSAHRLLEPHASWWDPAGIPWCGRRVGHNWFAIPALGPGWVFDPYAQSQRVQELQDLRGRLQELNQGNCALYFESILSRVAFGSVCERVFWTIHERILEAKQSVIRIPDVWLANRIWNGEDRPRHWRTAISRALESLGWLHVAEGAEDAPAFGPETALVTHAADLRRSSQNECDANCPLRGGTSHHHFLVNIGRGFLGILERCVTRDEGGIRLYEFPARGSRSTGANLKRLGRTGRLVSIYVPAFLGGRPACKSLSPAQHRLHQVLVRERTRKRRRARREFSEVEIIAGNRVVALSGRGEVVCPLLDANGRYVSFNGNKKRRGCGYLLLSEHGWLSKAGRSSSELRLFLQDLGQLSRQLGLIVVGLRSSGGQTRWLNLAEMQALANSRADNTLRRVHVRIYADENCVSQWDEFFGWPPPDLLIDQDNLDARSELQSLMRRHAVSQMALAAAMGKDPSAMSKILSGKRPCTPEFMQIARRCLHQIVPQGPAGSPPAGPPPAASTGSPNALASAIEYCRRGWSVIPQRPSTKRPYVRWTEFQNCRPTEQQLANWWQLFPDAGIALICGPLSGILVIDVDGAEARHALLARLGSEPLTPKALSGSGDPNRFHLFFRHPDFQTRAKATPWHPKLEFRGHAGLAVLPPSLHSSGNRYRWVEGQSINDLPLLPLPLEIASAIRPSDREPVVVPATTGTSYGPDVSPSTAEFLSGRFAEGPGWNERLFRAGCDLAARGVPVAQAMPLLLQGARPRDINEREAAIRTIESAYAHPRSPAVI